MESYIINSYAQWHYVPELSKGTNETQWYSNVYTSTATPPAIIDKRLKQIAWVYKAAKRGRSFRRKQSYTMYGLGFTKRHKRK